MLGAAVTSPPPTVVSLSPSEGGPGGGGLAPVGVPRESWGCVGSPVMTSGDLIWADDEGEPLEVAASTTDAGLAPAAPLDVEGVVDPVPADEVRGSG